MNKNIFLRSRTHVVNDKPVKTVSSTPIIKSNKYNPDVMTNYDQIKDYKIGDINYSNQTWKGITGTEFDFNPTNTENFKLEVENIDHRKITNDYEIEYIERERERLAIEEKNKQIKERMLQNVLVMTDEICDGNTTIDELPEYKDLKMQSGSDVLTTEQDEYNQLLNDIGNI